MTDSIVCDVEVILTPRQRLWSLLDGAMRLRGQLTLWARDYDGDIKRDFLRWHEAHPEHALTIGETRVITDVGWCQLMTADVPSTHLRAFSIYWPMVAAKVLEVAP